MIFLTPTIKNKYRLGLKKGYSDTMKLGKEITILNKETLLSFNLCRHYIEMRKTIGLNREHIFLHVRNN